MLAKTLVIFSQIHMASSNNSNVSGVHELLQDRTWISSLLDPWSLSGPAFGAGQHPAGSNDLLVAATFVY